MVYTNPLPPDYENGLDFKSYADDFNELNITQLAETYSWGELFGFGFSMKTAMVTAPDYIEWLLQVFLLNGGHLVHEEIKSLSQLTSMSNTDLVINCPGLGARWLGDVNDTDVYPQRGQTLIARLAGAETIWRARGPVDSTDPGNFGTFILPRKNGEIILGGTRQDNDYDTQARQAETDEILGRVGILWPPIKAATVVRTSVGLRPGRNGGIRLELDKDTFAVPVVHNYGHGGGGFETGPGCALQVAEYVASVFPQYSTCSTGSSASTLRPFFL